MNKFYYKNDWKKERNDLIGISFIIKKIERKRNTLKEINFLISAHWVKNINSKDKYWMWKMKSRKIKWKNKMK